MLESETYFARLGRSRKNYITTWAYSPYLYSRLSTNNVNLLGTEYWPLTADSSSTRLRTLRVLLRSTKVTWLVRPLKATTFPGNLQAPTPLNVPGRAFTEPSAGLYNYTHTITKTASILTKREDFYRKYLGSKGYPTTLNTNLRSSGQNPTLQLLKANFSLIDPNLITIESGHASTNLTSLHDSGLLADLSSYTETFKTTNLQKNQYRPMRKGVTNMVRLHATGAVAIPTEVRIHILASPKDVIHSWAIPSAGIKIDCIPGYSSHRITIFFNSGIYWGQCMEICGRFHHWMPIVLYIMKRDTFFVWVTHFIHYNKQTSLTSAIANTNDFETSPISRTKPFYDYHLPTPTLY